MTCPLGKTMPIFATLRTVLEQKCYMFSNNCLCAHLDIWRKLKQLMGYVKVIAPSEIPLFDFGRVCGYEIWFSIKDTHIHKHVHFISLTTSSSNKWEIYTLEKVYTID